MINISKTQLFKWMKLVGSLVFKIHTVYVYCPVIIISNNVLLGKFHSSNRRK